MSGLAFGATKGSADDDGRGEMSALDADEGADEGAVATAPAPACGWTLPPPGGQFDGQGEAAAAEAAASPPLT